MNIIVAADQNWAIGKDNGLLVHLPEDMKFFRETTTGHIVIMGRKTLDSFPGGRALKNRINLVVTSDPDFSRDGVIPVHSRAEALQLIDRILQEGIDLVMKNKEGEITGLRNRFTTDDFYVIGGQSIYRMFLDDCDRAYVTKIDAAYEADTFFPNLDEMKNESGGSKWRITDQSEPMRHEATAFSFVTYERNT